MAKKSVKHDDTKFMQSKVDAMFTLVKDKNDKVRICVGKYLASTKKFDTFKQAEEHLATKPYEIILNLAAIAYETNKNHEEKTKNAENNTAKSAKDK